MQPQEGRAKGTRGQRPTDSLVQARSNNHPAEATLARQNWLLIWCWCGGEFMSAAEVFYLQLDLMLRSISMS